MDMTNFYGINLKNMQVIIYGVAIKPYIVDGFMGRNEPFSDPILQLTIQLPMERYEQEKRIRSVKETINKIYGVKSRYTDDITIKNVLFNPPATIVFWSDGTKSVVKAQNGESFDEEKGLAMAILKHIMGNKGRYYNDFAKWCKAEKAAAEKPDENKTDQDVTKEEANTIPTKEALPETMETAG